MHVDRRVELVSIVEWLARAPGYNQAPSSAYVTDVDKTFRPFVSHPAVLATVDLRSKHNIARDAPMILAVHLDDAFALHDEAELPALDSRWKDVDVATYAATLRDFAKASGFDAFFDAHAAHYKAVADKLRAVIDAENPVAWFDNMFGPRTTTSYVVVPGMLTGPASFGVRANHGDSTEMFQILGVAGRDGMPIIDDEMVGVLVHEMGHSYVNPLFEQHAAELATAGSALFALVADDMKLQSYPTWQIMLNEAVVRAISTLFLGTKHGAIAGSTAAYLELRRGFVWTRELVELLRTRDATKPLSAQMPQIVAFFDERAKQYAAAGLPKLPFLGPPFAVLRFEHAWVAPTDAELARHVGQIHDAFYAKRALVAASPETLSTTKGNLVAWGTAASNPVVAAVLDRAKISIATDAITLGKRTVTGTDLALILSYPRPDDAAHGVVVYTAARDASLTGLFSYRHGLRDWEVVRRTPKGFEQVATGDFPHAADGAWLPVE